MPHEARAALLEWGAIEDAEGRLVVPNGSIRWSRAPHGWYREKRGHVDALGVRHEWTGLVHQLTRGGPGISGFLTPQQWEQRDELVARQKVLIDELEPLGVDHTTVVLPWVQDHLAEAKAAHKASPTDDTETAVREWERRLQDLTQLTWLVAWPDAWVTENYRQGIAERDAHREAQAAKRAKAEQRRERAAARRKANARG